MPKYVRTEKGIYEVVEDSNKEWGKQIVVKFPKNLNMKLADVKDQIIKQSDTIEELCDGVIEKCWSGNRFHYIWNFDKQEAIKVMNIDINKGYKEFYFGIFVEHNNKIDFISVAKMNEDGESVLI